MNARGVSLVELVVVLAILAILLAIVLPSYAYFSAVNRVAAFTNDVVGALQLARSEAIRRATRVTVCVSAAAMDPAPSCQPAASWQDGWIVFVDGGVSGTLDGDDQVIRVAGGQAVRGDLTISSNFADFVSYLASGESRGQTNLGNGTLSLCLEGHMRSIIVNNTGRVRLETEAC